MKFIKLISIIAIFSVLLTFTGCKDNKDNSTSSGTASTQSGERDYITLLYSASDSFNPYTVKTEINAQLTTLIYDSLVKLDDEFNPINCIANKISITENICTVELKNVSFSDGSTLTSDDVIYSYDLAKKSGNKYASKLYEVKSVTKISDNSLSFTLSKADPYFANVLDFPILKSGSDTLTDSDSVLLPPIGSGRYKVSKDGLSLVQNNNYYGKKGKIKKINLVNSPDTESVSHYVEIGVADMYFSTVSNGEILRMSGNKTNVNLNNMIYLGVNHSVRDLYLTEMRQAISTAIDRKDICKNAYFNNAVAATGFFNPVWKYTKSVQNLQIESNLKISVENLEKIGYNGLNSNGYRTKNGGFGLHYTLLVNSENRLRVAAAKLIAEQLKKAGIAITVVERPYEQYVDMLSKGNFELYIGEVKIPENMDLTSLVTAGSSAAYGVADYNIVKTDSENQTVVTIRDLMNGFYSGKNSITDIATVLQTEMPIIPICYRTGILFSNEKIENVDNSSYSDIYFSIESYSIKN